MSAEVRFAALADDLVRRGHLSYDPAVTTTPIVELVFRPPAGVGVLWRAPAGGPARTAAQAVIDGWDWTLGPVPTVIDGHDTLARALRAVVLVLVDQLNVLRANPTAVLPPITTAQARQALLNKVASGDAD